MKRKTLGGLLTATILLAGCTRLPEGLEAVTGFEAERYLGQWYEIARLDHSFERGLTHVSATYTQGEKGTIRVINAGYDASAGKWKRIEGRARFIGSETVGSLKVSFFGPIYGGYHIVALDRADYRHAMVAGPSRSYLWILARETRLDPTVYEGLVSRAAAWGFDTSQLIRVAHDPPVE